MRQNGAPILLIPLPVRVKTVFLDYLEQNKDDLTANQAAALERYASNQDILDSIVEHFFIHWLDNDRSGSLEAWALNSVQSIKEVYQ